MPESTSLESTVLDANKQPNLTKRVYVAPKVEEWRELPETNGVFWVSELGNVRKNGRIVKGSTDSQGYRRFSCSFGRYPKSLAVHRAVLYAFVGPPEPGREIGRHLNDIESDNSLSNLAWGSPKENMADWSRNYWKRKNAG